MEVISVVLAAGVGSLGIVGNSFVRSSEGLKVFVDPDSNAESLFAIVWMHVHC